MKNRECVLPALLFILLPCAASASTDSNQLGFYFEPGAESNCVEAAPYATVPVYLVLTEPDFDSLYGFEFGFSVEGSYLIQSVTMSGSGPIDVGGSEENHIVGLASPLTINGATVLSTLQVFVMDQNLVRFDLHNADPTSVPDYPNCPAFLLEDDEIIAASLAVPANLPSARINGMCNPETQDGSWDEVKSLYQ